jgi:hypothetical protein
MTLQEAQAKFSSIVNSVTVNMSSGELGQKQTELETLLNTLPNTPEFNPISEAIAEVSPKLLGKITQAVVDSLRSRDEALKGGISLFDRVSTKANADARTLTFEKPKLVLAALTETVTALKDAQVAVKEKNFESAASKIDSVVKLIEKVKDTIKPK